MESLIFCVLLTIGVIFYAVFTASYYTGKLDEHKNAIDRLIKEKITEKNLSQRDPNKIPPSPMLPSVSEIEEYYEY